MDIIKRPQDLDDLRKKAREKLRLREESDTVADGKCSGLSSGAGHIQILICGGTGCKASSSQLIGERFR